MTGRLQNPYCHRPCQGRTNYPCFHYKGFSLLLTSFLSPAKTIFSKMSSSDVSKSQTATHICKQRAPMQNSRSKIFPKVSIQVDTGLVLILKARRPSAQPGKCSSPCPPLCPRYLDAGQPHLSATPWAKRSDNTREE